MPDSSVRTLFVDTSSLRHAGFRNPNFQKLLLRSKAESVRIVVSEIAWEEWRTYNQFARRPAAQCGLENGLGPLRCADSARGFSLLEWGDHPP
jgi:hypothetical protein